MADTEDTGDASPEPVILDIKTLVDRPQIVIDQRLYDIVSPGELSLIDTHRVARWGRKFDRLMKLDEPTEAQEHELDRLVLQISEIIMAPVPAEVRERLTSIDRLSVIEVFTMLSLARKTRLAGAAVAGIAGLAAQTVPKSSTSPGTGAVSSPGSSGSMAETPSGG